MHLIRKRQPRPLRPIEPKSQPSKPPFSIRLSAPFLALGSLIIAVTVGWSFVMGYMVGRGENPGERLAQYDPFVRTEESLASKNAQTASKEADQVSDNSEGKETQKDAQKESQKEAQKDAEKDVPTDKKKDTEERKVAFAAPAHPFMRPEGSSASAWKNESVQILPKNEEKKTDSKDSVARNDYFYRVATYRTKNEAETLSKKLVSASRRSYVQQNGTVYSVYLSTKASDAEIAELKTLFGKLRIKDPLLMAKKESSQQKNAKKVKTAEKKIPESGTSQKTQTSSEKKNVEKKDVEKKGVEKKNQAKTEIKETARSKEKVKNTKSDARQKVETSEKDTAKQVKKQ